MKKFFYAAIFLAAFSCAQNAKQTAELPAWYLAPKQNNAENFYGVAEGFTLEEATKYSLADAAARLMVSISSESSLLRQESKTDVSEEMRQQVKQSIEKINFANFKVSRSQKFGQKIYVETQIERAPFLRDQLEKVQFLEKQIVNLDKNSVAKNAILRRNALLKILQLSKELELKSRILAGAGAEIDLKQKLNLIANFQNEFEKISDKTEFYFEINSPKEIAQIIRKNLNKEKIKVAPSRNSSNQNQIVISIKSNARSSKIYEAFITKLQIDFENIVESKTLASNIIEITGSSSISDKEAYLAALQALDEKISQDGILKIIGILN